jgi:hypothetical protein
MSQRPDEPRQDQDSEPTSAAGAASSQADQADDKEQSEGDPDKPPAWPPRGWPTAIGWGHVHGVRPAGAAARHEEDLR